MSIIEIKNLSKSYGDLKAVDDLSFSADQGQIVALAGPDGAGKTSTFRAACGLISIDSGEIEIAGKNVATDFDNIKSTLGYMPQAFSLYPDLSVEENLYFYAGLFGLSAKQFAEKKKLLYRFSGLGPFYNRRAGALSGGMKQKLALSCQLIHDPKVLILDEPTTGVDPLSRRQFWDILKNLRDNGSTIVVSTPYMDEVEMSNRAIFIFQGHMLAEGTPDQLKAMFRGKVYTIEIDPTAENMEKLVSIEGLSPRRFGSSVHVYPSENRTIEDFDSPLKQIGIDTGSINEISPELEDSFMQFMGK